MNVSGLDLLFIEVNNIDESLHFYIDLLGFKMNRHNPESEPPMATVQAGTLKITVAQHLETMLKRGRGVNLFLGVDDVDGYYRELTSKGLDVRPPVDEGWGGRFITLQDPDKYRFFFVTWSEDEMNNNEADGAPAA
jgi:predicted enzyme related to lactoylglutathione lyase